MLFENRKIRTLILCLFITHLSLLAQDLPLVCNEVKEISIEQQLAIEKNYIRWIDKNKQKEKTNSFTINLIFHLIHLGGATYMQEKEIVEVVERLNEIFANEGVYFNSLGVDTNIKFCLASRAPNGEKTNGINYFLIDEDYFEWRDSYWDNKYFCPIFVYPRYDIGGSYFNVGGADGRFISIGLNSIEDPNLSILTHELGHFLGLDHTFEPANNCQNQNCLEDGDKVCDTPPHKTLSTQCGYTDNTCSTDVNELDINNPLLEDQDDPLMNHMSYGQCRTHFTEGQLNRMIYHLEDVYPELQEEVAGKCGECLAIKTSFETIPPFLYYGDTLNILNTTEETASFQWYVNDVPVSSSKNLNYIVEEEGYAEIKLEAIPLDTLCSKWTYIDEILFYCKDEMDFWIEDYPVFQDSCSIVHIDYEGDSLEWIYNGMIFSEEDSIICIEDSLEIEITSSAYSNECFNVDTLHFPVIGNNDKNQFYGKVLIEPKKDTTLLFVREFLNIVNEVSQLTDGRLLISGLELQEHAWSVINPSYGFIRVWDPIRSNAMIEYQIDTPFEDSSIEIIDAISYRNDIFFMGHTRTKYNTRLGEFVIGRINQSGRLLWSYWLEAPFINKSKNNPLAASHKKIYISKNGELYIILNSVVMILSRNGVVEKILPDAYSEYSELIDSSSVDAITIDKIFEINGDIYLSGISNSATGIKRVLGNYIDNQYELFSIPFSNFLGIDRNSSLEKIGSNFYLADIKREQENEINTYNLVLIKLDSSKNVIQEDSYSIPFESSLTDVYKLNILGSKNGNIIIEIRIKDFNAEDNNGFIFILEIDKDRKPRSIVKIPTNFNENFELRQGIFELPNGMAYFHDQIKDLSYWNYIPTTGGLDSVYVIREGYVPSVNYKKFYDNNLLCGEVFDSISYNLKDVNLLSEYFEFPHPYKDITLNQKAYPLIITKERYEPSFECDTTFILPDYSLIVDSTYKICNDSLAVQLNICRDSFVFKNQIPISIFRENPLEQISPVILDTFINWSSNALCNQLTVNVPISGNDLEYTVLLNSKSNYNQPFELRYRYFDAVEYLESNYFNNWICVEIQNNLIEPELLSSTDTILCYGDSLLLQIEGDYDFIEWSTGSVSPSTIINSEGIVHLSVTDSCGLIKNDSLSVEILDILNDIEITIFPSDSLEATGSIEIECLDSSLEYSLEGDDWQSNCYYEMLLSGTYTLSIRNELGCIRDTVIIIPVNINVDTDDIYNDIQLNIFPNPAKDLLRIELKNNYIQTLNIYSVMGQLINSHNNHQSLILFSLADFSNGIYIIEVLSESGDIYSEKVIISK